MTDITQPLQLPCGATLPNRLAKAALTEGLADPMNRATERHQRIYSRWSQGGCGMILTGNVQVDRRYLERAGNVVVDNNGGMDELAAYAEAGTRGGNHLWMQIGHAGRQVFAFVNPTPVGPSAVAMSLGEAFGKPRALSEEEILNTIQRFCNVAGVAKSTGFTGVQIHGAHGYLISSFLSPLANQRTDRWGGSLENRARLLLETVRAVRRTLGAGYPVSLKLNSSDFQEGGFTDSDFLQVVDWLNQEGLDLLEVSGGNYESPSMMQRQSTKDREAYFLEFAKQAATTAKMPLMVTGGFRSRAVMDQALAEGACHVIGLGRPLVTEPEIANKLLADPQANAEDWENRLEPAGAAINWYYMQIYRMADGEDPDTTMDAGEARKQQIAIEVASAQGLQERDL